MKKSGYIILLILVFANFANAQNNLAVYQSKIEKYRYSKYLDSTKIYFKKALSIALKSKDSVTIFGLYKHMGDGYEQHQYQDSTLMMYDICDKFIPRGNLKLRAFLLNDRAYTLQLLHDYEGATALTLKALRIAEKSGDNTQIANVSTSLADGFSHLKMNKEAEKYYASAIKLSLASNNQNILHQTYRYYAIHLIKNKKYDAAFINLQKANKIALKIKDSISMAYNWYNMMDCYWQKNQKDSCFYYAKKAEKIGKIGSKILI